MWPSDKYVENLTVRYLPKAGHFVQEESPEEVNTIMKAWLEGSNVPGADKPTITNSDADRGKK
jgi:hypothetical protein